MKKIIYFVFSLLVIFISCDNVYAATANLLGNSSVIVGNSITITSKISSNNTNPKYLFIILISFHYIVLYFNII